MRPEPKFEPTYASGTHPLRVHLALTGIDREVHKKRAQRGFIPWGPSSGTAPWLLAEALPKIAEGMEDAYGWTFLADLAAITQDRLVKGFGVSLARATEIASGIALATTPENWKRVSKTSLAVATGKAKPGADDILFGEAKCWPLPKGEQHKGDTVIVCGTLAEIAYRYKNTSRLIAVSITEAAAFMRKRARKHKIKIENFWAEDLK